MEGGAVASIVPALVPVVGHRLLVIARRTLLVLVFMHVCDGVGHAVTT